MISPSLLSADFSNLKKDIEMINESSAYSFHLDIMDGVFVPNISFGFPIIDIVKKYGKKKLDVHLMIIEPDKYIEKFKNAGADILTVHYETCKHLHRTVQNIKNFGMKVGVSLNPHTSIYNLEDIIKDLDIVLIMSVNPGFGGQKFIENTYEKVKNLKNLIKNKKAKTLIEIDGGVNLKNAKKLKECGADILVAGNFIFKSKNPKNTINNLKNIFN